MEDITRNRRMYYATKRAYFEEGNLIVEVFGDDGKDGVLTLSGLEEISNSEDNFQEVMNFFQAKIREEQ